MKGATVTQPREDLPAARRRLDYAISALIEPKPRTVYRDGGRTEITWLDSLFDQLVEGIAGQTGERSGGQSKTPLRADLVELVREIDKTVAKWHPEFPLPDVAVDDPVPTTVARLQAIQARKWRVEDTAVVNDIAGQIELWVDKIPRKLDPAPERYLYAPPPEKGAAACPACGKDYVWRKDPDDNYIPKRQPALKVTDEGCRCQACRHLWDSYHLPLLALTLGYPLPEGVLD